MIWGKNSPTEQSNPGPLQVSLRTLVFLQL